MFPIRTDHLSTVVVVNFSAMSKDIPKNKMCWVEDCEKEIEEWPLCRKHRRMQDKGYQLEMKVAGIAPFDNTKVKI